MTTFRVLLGPNGPANVVVSDVDVTHAVSGGHVGFEAGKPTVLTLDIQAGGEISGDGLVQVASDVDHGQIVRDFLAQVDAKALEQEMLAGGLTTSPGQSALAALHQMADTW